MYRLSERGYAQQVACICSCSCGQRPAPQAATGGHRRPQAAPSAQLARQRPVQRIPMAAVSAAKRVAGRCGARHSAAALQRRRPAARSGAATASEAASLTLDSLAAQPRPFCRTTTKAAAAAAAPHLHKQQPQTAPDRRSISICNSVYLCKNNILNHILSRLIDYTPTEAICLLVAAQPSGADCGRGGIVVVVVGVVPTGLLALSQQTAGNGQPKQVVF